MRESMRETVELSVPQGTTRSLSTARAVLQVLAFLAEHPAGVRASEVAAVVGKSVSTAYYLLASLCEEGFAVHDGHVGRYRLAKPLGAAPPVEAVEPDGHDLNAAVELLFRRTRKRSYLGVLQGDAVEIAIVCGRQGVPRMPGLGTRITGNAHALAMGKVVLSLMAPEARRRYIDSGLRSFTPATITDPVKLARELAQTCADGFAVDREEFDADFCCVAAPVFDARGRARGVLALSAAVRAFDADRDALVAAVLETARTALDPGPGAVAASRRARRTPLSARAVSK